MARIDIKSAGGGSVATGVLQLENGVAMDATLRNVADQNNTTSPLKLSTTAVQVVSPFRITTDDPSDMYLDCEDGSANNRFNITRNTASQQVNLNFASNPGGSTTVVGGIRTFVDGVNLTEVMKFREDGQLQIGSTAASAMYWDNVNNRLGIGTNAPSSRLQVVTDDATNPQAFSNQTSILAGTASQGALISAFSSTNGAFLNSLWPGNAWFKMNYGGTNHNFSVAGTVTAVIDSNTTIGNGTTSLGARLGIKGSGSTSATTALLLQNSSGTQVLKATDDGKLTIGTNVSNSGAILFQFPQVGTNGVFWGDSYSAIWGSITLSRGTGEMAISANAGGYFQTFYTEGVERMRIDGAGRVAIGTAAPNASAKVQIDSTTQGFLPPRMTTTQKNAIATPAAGLMVYDTTLNKLCVYTTAWETITSI